MDFDFGLGNQGLNEISFEQWIWLTNVKNQFFEQWILISVWETKV